jgi:hypothetical protein
MSDEPPLPVLTPVARGARPPRRRWPLAVAAALAASVVGFSVATAVVPPRTRAKEAGPPRFGAGTRPRLERLRDLLARGLVDLRLPAGDYAPGLLDPRQDANLVRRQTTATAVAGLAAARRMGSRVEGLEEALAKAKAILTNRQAGTGTVSSSVKPDRARTDATLAAGILALAWGDDPADAARLDLAAAALGAELRIGAMSKGWARGIATRAVVELQALGRDAALGAPALSLVQVDPEPTFVTSCGDRQVSDAYARLVAGKPDAAERAGKILRSCLDPEMLAWADEKTDVVSWILQAWFAARAEGGDVWFERVLPLLEKAPNPATGVVEGTYYGDPVARTAGVLWILLEGWEAPPAKGG